MFDIEPTSKKCKILGNKNMNVKKKKKKSQILGVFCLSILLDYPLVLSLLKPKKLGVFWN